MGARLDPTVLPDTNSRTDEPIAGMSARRYLWPLAACGLILVAGAGSVIAYLQHEARRQQEALAIDDAQQFSRSVTHFRNFYSAEIVPRARAGGLPITHAYRDKPGTLPLPATFTLDFGDYLGAQAGGHQARLYSELPFPWRTAERKLDTFQRDALAALRAAPGTPFYRVETVEGRAVLRYAVADRMVESCVACHNSYADSPKVDWKVGDVRGVLEVRRPVLVSERMQAGLRNSIALSALVVASGMLLIGVAFRGLRASTRAAERLAAEHHEANLRLRGEVARRADAESTLRFSEATLRATFEGIADGVIVFDQDGRIAQANRVAAEMFRLAPDLLVGQSVRSLLPPEVLRRVAGEDGGRRRVEGMRADGTRFDAEVAIREVRLGDEPYFTAIVADATLRARHEREMAAARDAALDTARVKSQFLANMSHEIRTPMNGVIGMTGLLRDTALTGEQREMVETVQRSADALLTIIDDILDLSKIEAGKLRLQAADFDPVETIEDTLELIADRAAAKGLQLGYRLDGAVPRAMHGDEMRVRQVLNNLLSNAVKFTAQGTVEVTLAFRAESRLLEVRVRDTGPGIPLDKVRLLFQPFSQVDGSTTRRFGGTGLGLAISRQLVELMGGAIGVTTREGQGSLFHFTIAWHPPVAADLPDPLAALSGRRVLAIGVCPIQLAQMRSWGMQTCDPEALDGPMPDIALVDATRPDALAAYERLAGTLARCPDGGARVALIGRRAIAEAPELPRIAWPLRARAVAALLRGAMAGADPVAPAVAATGAAPSAAPRSEQAGSPPAPARRDGLPREALVVEDNLVNQTLAVALLKRLGIVATVVDNGARALEQLEARRWDIVLMDCQMPVMDGFEAVRRWREIEADRGLPRTPVIALTANAMEGDRERCLACGMDDYLSKPIDRAALAEVMASRLG
ncbi:MAG: ATP-binding protein [Burkholderiaceae bacterium]